MRPEREASDLVLGSGQNTDDIVLAIFCVLMGGVGVVSVFGCVIWLAFNLIVALPHHHYFGLLW